jgi:hypothetical protein
LQAAGEAGLQHVGMFAIGADSDHPGDSAIANATAGRAQRAVAENSSLANPESRALRAA